MSVHIKTPLQLYKYLLRCVKRLPPDAQPYYKHHIRQGFSSHDDENDEDRIRQIIECAVDDAQWVLTKYAEKKQ